VQRAVREQREHCFDSAVALELRKCGAMEGYVLFECARLEAVVSVARMSVNLMTGKSRNQATTIDVPVPISA
jgi:hypothetical protein